MGYGLFILQSLIAIAVILGGLYLFIHWTNRLKDKGRGAGPRRIEVLERTPFGPKQSFAIVRFDDRIFLVGVTDSAMTVIAEKRSEP